MITINSNCCNISVEFFGENQTTYSLQRELAVQLGIEPIIPGIVHSTILRFRKDLENSIKILSELEKMKTKEMLSPFTAHELLFTSETAPYMETGDKLYHLALKE